eukprot:tig00000053_g23504.t1
MRWVGARSTGGFFVPRPARPPPRGLSELPAPPPVLRLDAVQPARASKKKATPKPAAEPAPSAAPRRRVGRPRKASASAPAEEPAAESGRGFVVYRDDPSRIPWVAFAPAGSLAARRVAATAERLEQAAGPAQEALERGHHVQKAYLKRRSLSLLARIAASLARLETALGVERAAALRSPRGRSRNEAARIVGDLSKDDIAAALARASKAGADLPCAAGRRARLRAARAGAPAALERPGADPAADLRYGTFFRAFLRFLDSLAKRLSNKRFDADSPPFVGYISGPLIVSPVAGFDPATLPSYAEREEDDEDWIDEGSSGSPGPSEWCPSHSIEDVTWSLAETFSHLDSARLSLILQRLGLLGQESQPSLQQVGDEHGLTRERVRQLERDFRSGIPTGRDVHVPLLDECLRVLEGAAPFFAPRGGDALFRRGLCSSPGYHPASLLRLAELLGRPGPRLASAAFSVAGWPAAPATVFDLPESLPGTLDLLEIAARQARRTPGRGVGGGGVGRKTTDPRRAQVIAAGVATDASVAAAARAARDPSFDPESTPPEEDLRAARRVLGLFRPPEDGGYAEDGEGDGEEEGEGAWARGVARLSRDGRALRYVGPAGARRPMRGGARPATAGTGVGPGGGGRPRLPFRVLLQSVERASSRLASDAGADRLQRSRLWAAARAHALLHPAELAACLAASPAFQIDVWPEGGAPAPAPRELLEWLLEGPSRRPGGDGGALAAGDLHVRLADGVPVPPAERLLRPSDALMLKCLRGVIEEEGVGAGPLRPARIVAHLMGEEGLTRTNARAHLNYSPLLYRIETTSSRRVAERRISRKAYFAAWAVARRLVSVELLLDVPWLL